MVNVRREKDESLKSPSGEKSFERSLILTGCHGNVIPIDRSDPVVKRDISNSKLSPFSSGFGLSREIVVSNVL
jgi:hypothetical protein